MISFKVSFGKVKSKISTLVKGLSPEVIDGVVKARVEQMHKDFKEQTPIRWTGRTRNAWVLIHNKSGSWSARNYRPAIKYLLRGTPAHGPVTKKKLFIPLTAQAADAYRVKATYEKRAARLIDRGKTPKAMTRDVPKLKYGVDYVLRSFVKGIKPITLKSRGVYYGGESKSTAPSDRFVREYLKSLKEKV